jgi:hypothetical protein
MQLFCNAVNIYTTQHQMIGQLVNCNSVESGHSLIEVLPPHVPAELRTTTNSGTIAGVPIKIQTSISQTRVIIMPIYLVESLEKIIK